MDSHAPIMTTLMTSEKHKLRNLLYRYLLLRYSCQVQVNEK